MVTAARPQVILDTNVLVAGLRSRDGASFALLESLRYGEFEIHVSVPLVLEYLDVLLRQPDALMVSPLQAQVVVESLCAIAHRHKIHFLVRPVLRDPLDDMLLELAAKAGVSLIVTHNVKDFVGSEQFGVRAVTPVQFLEILRGLA